MTKEQIAQALKEYREEKQLTQSKLARDTGIKQQRISYYESGRHAPPITDCIILANYYGITLDDLVGRTIT